MKKSSTAANLYELVIKTLKEIGGTDDLMTAKRLVTMLEKMEHQS